MTSSTSILSSALRIRNPTSPLCYLQSHINHRQSTPLCLHAFLLYYSSASSSSLTPYPRTITSPPHPPSQSLNPNPIARIPREKQFETWVFKLNRGFSPDDVVEALQAQSDPDLALDIFRWASLQRGYNHNHLTYLCAINLLISGKRYSQVETLLEEVLAGPCEVTAPLYNSLIRFSCGRTKLFHRAFDLYKKMLKSQNCKPTVETYTLLLSSLLRRLDKMHVCHVYLPAVRSMENQMKASGVIPDTFLLNLIIKAYTKCLEVDEAMRVFQEMGLYECEPNQYTYSFIVKGLCEKGRLVQGLGFYKEMKSKGLVPMSSTCLVLICSLSFERMFEDAIEVVFEQLDNSLSPDLLTYKTLLEELCRVGKVNEANELLEEFRKRDSQMSHKTYKILLNGLYS